MHNDKIVGINAVREAVKAGRPIQRILISERRKHDSDVTAIMRLAKEAGIESRVVSRDLLNRQSGASSNQGIVAVIAARQYSSLDDILRRPAELKQVPLFLILDGVEDPRNLGAIIRTAEAAGVHGVIIPERRAAGLTDTVAKAASGALEHVSVVKVVNVVNTIETLKQAGIWVVGAEAEGDTVYWDADFVRPLALVIGGEDRGVRRLVREKCDYIVSLPLTGQITSLNVSVAAGVLLYEVLRQRTP